jgi:2-methylisocitrate lyase-like PEP mutase family enzyme
MSMTYAPKPSLRALLARDRPLVLPGAYDAVSALLIERAGFDAYFIGGFPLVGARFGLPDIGLAGLGEIAPAVQDIVSACRLPALVDADNGYGDVKNVVHVVHTYERMGIAGVMLEDQVLPKRCGHIAGKDVIPTEEMVVKIRAAAENRLNPDTFILARTDARDVLGLDEAFRRAERYLAAGADGIFIESPHSVAELEQIGRKFDVPQLANMLEGGCTPILSPKELFEIGFRMPVYGISLLLHAVRAMQGVLGSLAAGDIGFIGKGAGFDEFKDLVGFDRWAGIEERYGSVRARSG